MVDRYLGGLLVVVRALGLNRMAKDDGGAPWSSCWARRTQIMLRDAGRGQQRKKQRDEKFFNRLSDLSLNSMWNRKIPLPEIFQKHFSIEVRSNSMTISTTQFKLGLNSQSDGMVKASTSLRGSKLKMLESFLNHDRWNWKAPKILKFLHFSGYVGDGFFRYVTYVVSFLKRFT